MKICLFYSFFIYFPLDRFLVDWLLSAKKIGHKLYGIVRRKEFIDYVNEYSNVDNNSYEAYKAKIMKLIETNNYNHFINEILYQPIKVLSIINIDRSVKSYNTKATQKGINLPLLITLGLKSNKLSFKWYDLFLSSIFHFNKYMNKNFSEKYLNYGECNNNVIYETTFWGITKTNNDDKIGLKLIEKIMSNTSFQGLSQMISGSSSNLEKIFDNCIASRFKYMLLMVKYFDKNREIFDIGMGKTRDRETLFLSNPKKHPLYIVVKATYMENDDQLKWINLLLYDINRQGKLTDKDKMYKVPGNVLQTCFNKLRMIEQKDSDKNKNQCKNVLLKYAHETKQKIDENVSIDANEDDDGCCIM